MEIIEVTSQPPYNPEPQVLVIGKFDGVHKGHQAILKTAKEYVGENESLAVFSFSDHPYWILKHDPEFERKLTTDKEKINILKRFGVKRYYRVHFTQEYAKTTAEEFVLEHLVRMNVKRIVAGEGFNFGKGGNSGTEELIQLCAQINIAVTIVPLVRDMNQTVSSTTIRSMIKNGDVEAAQDLLGRPYAISGIVIHGEKLGRKLGFPTINLGEIGPDVLPKPGVYFGNIDIQDEDMIRKSWHTIISAGYRPTVNGQDYLIEAYILDFSGDLYGKSVTVSFMRYMRDEIKFDGLDPLIEQMEADKAEARQIIEQSAHTT